MAVTNVWGTGHSVLVPQLRSTSSTPSSSSSSSYCCSFDCFSKKSGGLRLFLMGRNDYWGVPRKQFLKSRQSSKLSCRCSGDSGEDYTRTTSIKSYKDWDWNKWTRHFEEIEQAESFVSVLKFQLEDAIEKEDFEEAAKLKIAIQEATSKDAVAKIMSDLKSAIDEERYHDASRLCRSTGSGLVGWWVGCSKDSDDPFGRLIRITPGVGRFVGRSYSPRQLITASPGAPLFEIFVTKDADESYTMQVAFLRRAKVSSKISTKLSSNSSTKGPSTSAVEDASEVDIDENETKAEKSADKNINIEGATEEGITSVINFLKEKIPELKLKVMKINVTEEVIEDADAVKQLIEEDDEDISSDESTDDEASDGIQPDRVVLGEGNEITEDGKNLDMKVFIGGVLHNKEDNSVKDEFVRLPAEVKDIEKDSFVLHVPVKSQDQAREENVIANVKVASIAAKSVSELMPSDVAKAFMGSDKISPKVSKDVREIVKLAVSQAQKREKLSEYTTFSRITTSENDLDPFDGLYVGAFGPYGTEVVQLRRKYGNWSVKDDTVKSSDVEFFEYVEAVKLTGDLNVPAGQVTFRARLGRGNRVSNRGLYPDELGVVASYKGQGRIAEFGFRNPKWVDGELLQLNGKGMGPYVKGADLGFLYVVPEQSFLVLFNRLKLPD